MDAVQDRSDLKIIVAPSAAAASSIRTALARTGRGLVNLEALTPGGLAFHILKAMDPIGARRFIGSLTMECVIAGALLRRDDNAMASLFSRSVSAITSSLVSDRMVGRSAAWAREHAKGGAQGLYADLLDDYEAHLAANEWLDHASVLREAHRQVDRFRTERHVGKVLVLAETRLVPGQAELLNALAPGGIGQLIGGGNEVASPGTAGEMLADWEISKKIQRAGEVKVIQAATRREEALAVLQDIRSRGLAISDVELAVTDPAAYRPLFRSLSRRLNLSTSFGSRSGEEPFVRWLSVLLEWMHSPEEAKTLAGMLRTTPLTGVDEPSVLATTLDQFPVTMSMLDRTGLRESLLEGAKRNWTEPARVDALLDFLRAFRIHRWPARLTPRDAVRRLRESALALWPHDAATSWQVFEERFSDFDKAPHEPLPSRWLAHRMAALLMDAGSAQRDAGTELMIVPLKEAGFGPRRHVWVLGMDDKAAARAEGQEGSHFAGFASAQEDAGGGRVRLQVNELRKRIGPNLTLCAPAFDVQDGRYLFPSAALIEHAGIEQIVPEARRADLDVADAAMDLPVPDSFSSTRSGLRALANRRSKGWTAWDGKLPSVPAGDMPTLRTSTSRLEMLAACPFKFWLSEILNVPVAPEPSKDWLSASDLGLMVHDLFEHHTRSRAAGHSGTGTEDEQSMLLQLRAALERQAVRSGADRSAAVGQRYEELAHAVRQYFQRERALEGQRQPVHAEYPIHEPGDPETRTISIDLPSGSIQLSGRIDRIDESVDGSWIIIDYKTGSWKDFVPAKLKSLDSKLQWALYSMAAARLSGRTVEQAEYVFTSSRGSGWVSAAAPPPEDVILDLLNLLLARFRTGAFVQAADKNGVCTWCDFKAVCGDLDDRKRQLKAKFEQGEEDIAVLYETWPQKP